MQEGKSLMAPRLLELTWDKSALAGIDGKRKGEGQAPGERDARVPQNVRSVSVTVCT